MNLEDHLGDILRKAREAAGVSVSDEARTGGLSASDYTALETAGASSTPPDLAALASLLGLDARKLGAVASGGRRMIWARAVLASCSSSET